MHSYLTQPTLNPEDRILHAVRLLTCTLDNAPAVRVKAQLQAIADLRDVFSKWHSDGVTPTMANTPPRVLMLEVAPIRVPYVSPQRVPAIQRQSTPTQTSATPAPTPSRVSFSEDTSRSPKTRIRVSPRDNLLRYHPPGWSHQPVAHCTPSSRQLQTPPPPHRRRRPCLSPLAHDRDLP